MPCWRAVLWANRLCDKTTFPIILCGSILIVNCIEIKTSQDDIRAAYFSYHEQALFIVSL